MSKETVVKTKKEEFKFQAEMDSLLHLITHSLYSNREIFLRELISNSSDALKKIHFNALTDGSLLGDDKDLKIQIKLDEEAKTLSIQDNGIGMSHEDLQNNIGTIAKSGTQQFASNLTGDQKKDSELIGRFGVGFYAVFMVAEEVTVISKTANADMGYKWISKGTGSYTIEEAPEATRGTLVSFKLKEDAEEFASKWRVENIVKKYSDFVSFPIELNEEVTNKSSAIWTKNKSEVTEEEYNEFFKYISHKQENPKASLHFNIDSPTQFKAIVFVPETKDHDLMTTKRDTHLQLYVKRVFIQDDCKDVLPQWLRFVHGIVDSEDLPLNVSREVTQDSPVMLKIKKYLTKKLLAEFKSWAEKDVEKYEKFWNEFGVILKEGIHLDFENKDKLLDLYRCNSSANPDKLVSFQEYIDRMKEDQEEIYYVFGKNKEIIEKSPNIEYFRKNDIEVLYLYEEIDEFLMPSIGQYKEKSIVGIDKADLKIKKDEKKDDKKDKNALSSDNKAKIISYIKEILGDRVSDVIESQRLVDSPCTLVSAKDAMNSHMEQMMRSMGQDIAGSKKIFEVNLDNSLIRTLSAIQIEKPEENILKECVEQLFESASLLEGSLDDPSKMVPRTFSLMEKATSLLLDTFKQ